MIKKNFAGCMLRSSYGRPVKIVFSLASGGNLHYLISIMCQLFCFKISQSAFGYLAAVLGATSILFACHREPAQKQSNMNAPASTEVLIKFKPGVPADSVQALTARLGLEHVRDLPAIGVRVFRTSPRISVAQVLRACQSDSCVEYAEPNSTVKIPEQN